MTTEVMTGCSLSIMEPLSSMGRASAQISSTYSWHSAGSSSMVRMPGISHLIVETDSVFFSLRENRPAAEQAVREWCGALGTGCLGLMFLEHDTPGNRLTPLVCVPGSGTVFWENSCASGSSAAGMVLAARSGDPVDLAFSAPGGTMRVRSDADGIWLFGQVKQLGEYQI